MNLEENEAVIDVPCVPFSVTPGTAVCPFVCSTVEDFQNEHRILHEKVFPELQEVCRLRNTRWSAVDFGWSSSFERQESSVEFLRLCLDYVVSCSPFFLCLLGKCYGPCRDQTSPLLSLLSQKADFEAGKSWLDNNILCAASSGYSWLLDESIQYSSFPEILIKQGAFPSDAKAADAAQRFSFFYFRQPDHIELLESSLQQLGVKERVERLSVYEPQSESATLRVEKLKSAIVREGLSVRYFSTPEQLATMVHSDWKAVIESLHPPLKSHSLSAVLKTTGCFLEEFETKLFAATCRRSFVHTAKSDDILDKLTCFAFDGVRKAKHWQATAGEKDNLVKDLVSGATSQSCSGGSVLLLVGKRGCGKSCLLANWVKSFRHISTSVKIFEHYVGSSADSENAVAMMRRCTAQFREDDSHLPATGYGFNLDDDEHLEDRIREEFLAAISSDVCLLVLDNLSGFSRCGDKSWETIKEMKWLPFPLPPTINVIATCTRNDLLHRLLIGRSDVAIVSFPTADDVVTQRAILNKNMELSGTIFDRGIPEFVLGGHLSNHAIYLSLLGGELRMFVDTDDTLGSFILCREASSICDVWRNVVQRWMKEYSWSVKDDQCTGISGWIPDILRLIAVSHDGLTKHELLEMLAERGYTGASAISTFDWLRFRMAASNVLREKSSGLIRFLHSHIEEATGYVLFGCLARNGGYGKMEASAKPTDESNSILPSKVLYHRIIADYFQKQDHSIRRSEELPWQLGKLQDYSSFAKVIADHRVFLALYDEDSDIKRTLEILDYWKTLMKAGYHIGSVYHNALNKIDNEYPPVKHTSQLPEMKARCFTRQHSLMCIGVGQLLMRLRCSHDAIRFFERGIVYLNQMMPLSRSQLILLSRMLSSVGCILAKSSNNKQRPEAVRYFERALEPMESVLNNVISARQRRNLLEGEGCIFVYLGRIKIEEGRLSEAENLLQLARKNMEQAQNTTGRALVLYHTAILYLQQGNYIQSEELLLSSLKLFTSYLGRSHPNVARIYSKLGFLLGNPLNKEQFSRDKAKEYYKEAIRLNEECFGASSIPLADDLFGLGDVLWHQEDMKQKQMAIKRIRRAYDIYTLKLGDEHVKTRQVREKLASWEILLTLGIKSKSKKEIPQLIFPSTQGSTSRGQTNPPVKSSAEDTPQSTSEQYKQVTFMENGQDCDDDDDDDDDDDVHIGLPKLASHSTDMLHKITDYQSSNRLSVREGKEVISKHRDFGRCLVVSSVKILRKDAITDHQIKSPLEKQVPLERELDTLTAEELRNTETNAATGQQLSCSKNKDYLLKRITADTYPTVHRLLTVKQFILPTVNQIK